MVLDFRDFEKIKTSLNVIHIFRYFIEFVSNISIAIKTLFKVFIHHCLKRIRQDLRNRTQPLQLIAEGNFGFQSVLNGMQNFTMHLIAMLKKIAHCALNRVNTLCVLLQGTLQCNTEPSCKKTCFTIYFISYKVFHTPKIILKSP